MSSSRYWSTNFVQYLFIVQSLTTMESHRSCIPSCLELGARIVAQAKIRNDLQNSSPTGSVPKFVSTTFNLYVLLGVERMLWTMMSRPSHGIPNTMLTCCGQGLKWLDPRFNHMILIVY